MMLLIIGGLNISGTVTPHAYAQQEGITSPKSADANSTAEQVAKPKERGALELAQLIFSKPLDESVVNSGLNVSVAATDQSISKFLKNDELGTSKSTIRAYKLPGPTSVEVSILTVDEAPDIAVYTVKNAKDYYRVTIVVAGKKEDTRTLGDHPRVITLAQNLIVPLSTVAGNTVDDAKSIVDQYLQWMTADSMSTPFLVGSNGKVVKVALKHPANESAADSVFIGMVQAPPKK